MPLRSPTPQELEVRGRIHARHIAHYLYANYCRWTNTGKQWRDFGARDAYYVVCDLWKIQRAA